MCWNLHGYYSIEDAGRCDLFVGDWIPHPGGPVYTNETCDWIEGHQNCMKNGRPDTGYLYWRWSPRECELPQLNPNRFLESMRNKALALIGDSISRNHIQSLICVLSKVKSLAVMDWYWKRLLVMFICSVLWDPLCNFSIAKLSITWSTGAPYIVIGVILVQSGLWYHEVNIGNSGKHKS